VSDVETALTWVRARTPAPPPQLADDVAHALAALPRETIEKSVHLPELFAAAALDQLQHAARIGTDRAAAYALLTSDALFTYAFEAAAELGIESLERIAAVLNPSTFAELLSHVEPTASVE